MQSALVCHPILWNLHTSQYASLKNWTEIFEIYMCCKHMQIYVTIQCAELWNQKIAEMCNKNAQTFIFDYKNMQYQAIIG